MSMPKRFILLFLIIFLASCTEENQLGSAAKEVISSNNSPLTIQNYPSKITYLRMNANFTRSPRKEFTIITLDILSGAEKEYNNKYYENSIISKIYPDPSGEKIITGYQKYSGAPFTIVEIELDSGEVTVVPNTATQSHLPRYSPDGTKIVYHDAMNADNHARVVIYDIDEEKGEHLPCKGVRCWQPDWHPDGTKIVFVEDKKKIIEYDLKSRTQSTRYALKELQSDIEVLGPKYSPDGTKILFLEYKKKKTSLSNYRKQNIRKLIKLDKNNKDTVVYERKGIYGVEWCPDSKHIIYTAANLSDRKNLSEMHLLKLGEEKPKIIKSFDQEHIKAAAYCR